MENELIKLFPTALPYIVCYSIACGCAYSCIQSIKLSRRECRAPAIPNFLIRAMAGVFSGVINLVCLIGFYDFPLEHAALHGFIAGMLFPVFMTVAMSYIKVKFPVLYGRLRVQRRRPTDDRDPDDTMEGFF